MDLISIRQDFPALGEGKIFFDNACSTLRPQSVIEAVNDYYKLYPTCGGRSNYAWAQEVTERCERARQAVAGFLGAKRADEVIFLRNATEGINLVAKSLALQEGDAVVISDKEHNSNLLPWLWLQKRQGIKLKIISSNSEGVLNLDELEAALKQHSPRLVSLVWTSNIDGVTNPATEIIKLCRQAGALVLLDAAQTALHQKIEVKKIGADFLVLSGHKLLGPSGIGVLWGRYGLLEELSPFLLGGSTVEDSSYQDFQLLPPPHKFEAGLQDYAGIIGLGEAVKYLAKIGFKNIKDQEEKINQHISQELADLPKLHLIGPSNWRQRGSIFNFYLEGLSHHEIAILLEKESGIMVRSGQHCVHSWYKSRGIPGSVRASFAFYNTLEEAEIFVSALKRIYSLIA
ncbi:cysteine desulfurase [Candidatus Parcubacteria bacterium]|nr:MAG: cysteine desulfurase [Candidatus Parcubacteria bacterium]